MEPVADRHWLSKARLLLFCIVDQPCPTATPEPTFGHTVDLVLENNNSFDCAQFIICVDGQASLQFDLGSIPSGADITQARLVLSLSSGVSPAALVTLGRVSDPWSEDTNGRPTCDFTTAVTNNVANNPGQYGWDVTSMVRNMQANPASDFGFCLRIDGHTERVFVSREGPLNQRPHLEIVYEP